MPSTPAAPIFHDLTLPREPRKRRLPAEIERKIVILDWLISKTTYVIGIRCIHHVYFPVDSYVSLVTRAAGEASLEVGLVGDEGMHGIALALGIDESPLHALVQGAGPALRLSANAFRRECAARPALQRAINRYLYVLMSQLAQSAACTRFHLIQARLARWLLMTQDRAHSDTFSVTHEFLAWMLGVRRVGVTEAASALQERKLIEYRRGHITILDHAGLEAASCACYALVKGMNDAKSLA